MKTRKELNEIYREYLIDCISSEDKNINELSDKDKVQFLFDNFKSVNYENNKKRYPNLQDRFANWFQGLPSTFNLDFENYRILELLYNWEVLTESDSESKKDKYLNNWFKFWAAKTLQLASKLKVDYSDLY